MIKLPLATMNDDASSYVEKSALDEVRARRHGKAAAVLTGFADGDDWFDCWMEHAERLVKRIAESRRVFKKTTQFQSLLRKASRPTGFEVCQ